MDIFDTFAIILSLAAGLAYVNYRFLKLPTTIGLMVLAMGLSLVVVLTRELGVHTLSNAAQDLLSNINFSSAVLNGMLGYLLFAGALQVNLGDLRQRRWEIFTFATLSTAISAFVVGSLLWGLFIVFGITINPIYCYIFGALISPTDPVAVLAILKTTKVPKLLRVTIAGESLLNDGVGVVLFTVLVAMLDGAKLGAGQIAGMFLLEALGGAILGLVLAYVTYRLIKQVHDYKTEILLTIALAMASYTLATTLHMSGAIAAVAAGLFIGNQGKRFAMSARTREHLDSFWDLVDEVLNAILFVLIGLEILVVQFRPTYVLVGLAAILIVLIARAVSVSIPLQWFTALSSQRYHHGALGIMTWGGLRGGIPIALALLIPRGEGFNLILTITYIVVAFSIIVQGLTIKRVVERYGYGSRDRKALT